MANINHLSALIRKIRDTSEAAIIVHHDKDYLKDDEVERWNREVRRTGAKPFVTSEIDIESYFASPDHVERFILANGGPEIENVTSLIDQSLQDEILKDFVNGRQHVVRNRNDQTSSGSIAVEANNAVSRNSWYYLNGKKKIKILRRIFQEHGHTRFNPQSIRGCPTDATLLDYARAGVLGNNIGS